MALNCWLTLPRSGLFAWLQTQRLDSPNPPQHQSKVEADLPKADLTVDKYFTIHTLSSSPRFVFLSTINKQGPQAECTQEYGGAVHLGAMPGFRCGENGVWWLRNGVGIEEKMWVVLADGILTRLAS